MKKCKVLILTFIMLCCSLAFLGCGKNKNDFIEVCSVVFSEYSRTSYYTIKADYSTLEDIDETEFNSFPDERKKSCSMGEAYFYGVWEVKETLNNTKSNLPNFKANEFLAIKGSKWTKDEEGYVENTPIWNKVKIKEFKIVYVNVKVINERTLEIDFDNTLEKVSTDFYKIEYFSN